MALLARIKIFHLQNGNNFQVNMERESTLIEQETCQRIQSNVYENAIRGHRHKRKQKTTN
jgi:hypothetical protein